MPTGHARRTVKDMARPARFVVGYDGSQSSLAAVREAARRADPDGQLFVVHAYPPPSEALGWPLYESAARDAKIAARQFVAQLRGLSELEDVEWAIEAVAGPAAKVIDAAAREHEADEIFLGSRGVGRTQALLGSVAHDVLHRADRPVTVITERAAAAV